MEGHSTSEVCLKPKFHLHNSKLQIYAQNAIKKSNVKSFVNQGVRSSERLNLENNQSKHLSQHLLHLKNSCNELKKDITNKQNEAVKLKDQTSYTTQKVKQLQNQRQKLEEKITNLTKDVELVHTKKQSTFHSFKTYEHLLWRMKKDQITNQIRKNNLQKQIINMQKQVKLIQNKLYSLKQYEQLSFKGLRHASQQIQVQHQQRKKKVVQMSNVLQQKKICQNKKQERHNQTKSIQQMAAGDFQDADLIRMKKFLQVQIFLKHLLKDKMERLKDYYEPYEMAFYKIKSQTSAKDANSLKAQFFNFQSQYQQRTAWIKHLETQISNLENQKKQLDEELIRSKESELDLLQQMQEKGSHETQDVKQSIKEDKNHLNKRSLESELMMMKIKEWTNFQSKKVVGMNQNAQTQVTNELKSQNQSGALIQNFKNICDFLITEKQREEERNKQQKMKCVKQNEQEVDSKDVQQK